ncbi:ABC transporter substrate-binding protein [Nocardioides flavus (ex Wang et al. 2016)]|uniref:ABC transporter substrate-binding protein n=1 Tax=Nocardioides flavus (ex Wang et al. 2016) TaxID=2058780 RepID=A0ABQ3HGE3_9ACTN|nr:ABC transporter substrate-binding protein [Nocardioides flavus (ex Wang et al. 2016)]GHE15486.1 ABC transporter substrate-binding protein [Nocardioides flavus (ex Wang et al. 2016)]
MNQPRNLPIALALAASLILAGCGEGDDASSSPAAPENTASSGGYPVTIDGVHGEVTLDEQPQRIVSLSPSATEILFAIGAGDQVVAADEYSTYPAEAPTTDLSAYDPNVEAIAGHEPDLVVIANDTNGIVGALAKLDIPTIVNPAPATVEDGYDGVAALGLATGHVDETAKVVADMRAEVADALEAAPQQGLRVYHELDEELYAASSHSFIGSVYDALGATNVADAADKQRSGYPQLTEEAVIAADPELIVITDQVSYTAEDVASRPGWENVSAVRNGDIVTVDADISSRWGPRLPQMIESIADAMTSLKTPVG